MPARYTALIAGATGATAKRLTELLTGDRDWRVIGVCRNPPPGPHADNLTYESADLMQAGALDPVFDKHRGVTHVFYCCRAPHGESGVESVEDNFAMFRSVLDSAIAGAPKLAHVHLIEGAKWYGMHIGAMATPCEEDDPRHVPPNFYYDQEDYMRARQEGAAWTWSASRPNFITDFAPERPRNLVTVLGGWAVFCREFGMALEFPGKPDAYTALLDITDATHLARAIRHMAVEPACANQAFNVTNGEPIRWSRVWPKLAAHFRLKAGPVRSLSLAHWMSDKEPVWQAMTERHGLSGRAMGDVIKWDFADFALNLDRDVFLSLNRLRSCGFTESVDTTALLLAQIDEYRAARELP